MTHGKHGRASARAVFATLALGSLATTTVAADLEVRIQAVRSAEGQIRLALYEREQSFRKEEQARQLLVLPATTGEAIGRFRDLPPGRYAVLVYHDENGDGKLNLRLGMFPKEGYGLSNNPGLSGPPKFGDAAFELDEAGGRIDVRLAY
jgi:uncharacterized protein (DUF2141 family)